MTPRDQWWRGRRVLLTGHTGFKGTWLANILRLRGAEVMGIALAGPHGSPSLWDEAAPAGVSDVRADIASDSWQSAATDFAPEVVLHLAAQSLVSVGYARPEETFRSNVAGTAAVLAACDGIGSVTAAMIVTTDKVYDVRQPAPYRESDYLGGHDPYAASKAAAELVTHSWPSASYAVGTARAGNVIGGGDWALDRIVPDLVRAWQQSRTVVLRRPDAIRPWQHVIEPLVGYLDYARGLAERSDLPTALNFGPSSTQAVTVLEFVEFAASVWRRLVADSDPSWEVRAAPDLVETTDLTLDSTLAEDTLGWAGRWDWQTAVSRTIEWYVEAQDTSTQRELIAAQVATYEAG